MISMQDLFNGSSSFYIGVAEFEENKVVGILDDPIGLDPNSVQLGYPVEFLSQVVKDESSGQMSCGIQFIVPSLGIPECTVISTTVIEVYGPTSTIGRSYLAMLKRAVSEKHWDFPPMTKVIYKNAIAIPKKP